MPIEESCLARDGAAFMPPMLQIAIIPSSAICCKSGKDNPPVAIQNVAMAKGLKKTAKPKHPHHYLMEWREFRHMTQEQLAASLKPPTTASVISLLENRERGLSNKWLERLAPVLGTKKGFILDVDPNSVSTSVLEIFGSLSATDQKQALDILETFKRRTGS